MSADSTGSQEVYLSTSEGGITPASVIAVGAVLSGLAAIAVALRFYVRIHRTRTHVGLEDWLILVSFVLTLGLGLMLIIGSALGGLSRPTPQGNGPKGYLTATNDAEILTEKIFWAFNLVQCFAFGAAKLSVLYFYRRIFQGKLFNTLSISLIIVVIIWTLGFFLAILFRCGTQFWALWAPLKYLLANCYASTPMFQAFTISDVVTDVLIIALPVYRTLQLHMPLGKRLAVCGVFLLGAVVIAAGVARLVIFIQQTNSIVVREAGVVALLTISLDPYQNADGIGHLTTEIYWSMLEMGISIIAACLPTLWPLVNKVSLENMIRSVRSMLSLESLNSSGRGRTVESDGSERDTELSAPDDRFSAETGGSSLTRKDRVEKVAMPDLKA